MLLWPYLSMSFDAHMDALLLGMYLEVESLDPRIDICSAVVDNGYTLVMHFVERFVHHFTGEEIGVHGGYITCLRSHC